MGLRLIVSRRLYFGLLYNISNFHGKYFDLFHTPPPPPFFKTLYHLVSDLIVLFFKGFFFAKRDPIREVFGQKKLSVGPALNCVTRTFWLVTQNL